MLLALTPNPTIDRTLLVPEFRTSEVRRVAEAREAAGGKGLNVARVFATLGGAARVCGPLGGEAGRRIAALAAAEGIDARWSWLSAGESRTCTIVIDPGAPDTLVLNERGPVVGLADWHAIADLTLAEARGCAAVCVSGSLPPGAEPAWLADLLADLLARGQPAMLDTSGPALRAALGAPLALLKVNAEELGEALGHSLPDVASVAAAARELQRRGPRLVIITMGRDGAVGVGDGGAWLARPPDVAAISPVGSGDALLAGAAAALLERRGLPEALRLGVACGAANTLSVGGGVVLSAHIEAARAAVRVEPLA